MNKYQRKIAKAAKILMKSHDYRLSFRQEKINMRKTFKFFNELLGDLKNQTRECK